MPVTYLELENFKSYSGFQRIGPFKDFTSVIGPNGAGKSNLMDAISFVFGVQSRALRSSQMKDLIFRPPGDKKAQRLQASATLIYEDDEGNETRFSRSISPNGVGEYSVDGGTVLFKDYEKSLAEIGVFLKSRNFLVFQGDVESIARKSPKELVEMLEEISGSAELKAEYEAAFKRKEEAEAASLSAHLKQKGFKSERKMLKDQKEEAERFHALLEERSDLQTEMYLWLLYHIDQDMTQREEAVAELRAEIDSLLAREEEATQELRSAKKQASSARRKTAAAEKKRVNFAATVGSLDPEIMKATEEMKNLRKKIADDEDKLQKIGEQTKRHKETVAQLKNQISEYKETKKELEKEYENEKRSAAGETSLSQEQEEELDELRQAAAAASDEPRRLLNNLTRKLESARAKAATLTQEYKEVESEQSSAVNDRDDLSDRKKKLIEGLAKTQGDFEAAEKELQAVQRTSQETQARREAIDTELENINLKLRDAQDVRSKSRDEERFAQAIASLKRHFTGVHGRLVDLCRPTQRRFNMAVTVAGGKDMDAIVVDTKEVGFDCMKYLRDQRVGVATFLPLDSLQVPSKENMDSVRMMVGQDNRFRLAADIITCEDGIRNAVLYAVGTTVVCEDLDSAREICFGSYKSGARTRDARLKAVTLGGAVISKAGTMTGGLTRDDTTRAGRWNDQKIKELRDRKDELEKERTDLFGLGGAVGHESKMEELRNNIGNLRNRMQYSRSDLEFTSSKYKEKKALATAKGKVLKQMKPKIGAVETEIESLIGAVDEASKAVKKAEDEHLAPFREKTGLHDLKAYEEAVGRSREEFMKKRQTVVEHITKLEQQRDYEANRDMNAPVARTKKRIDDRKDALIGAKEKAKELKKQMDAAKESLSEAENAVSEATKNEQAFDDSVNAAQKVYDEAQRGRNTVTKSIQSEESALERLRGKLHETLQKARVEEVNLPALPSSPARSTRSSQASRRTEGGGELGSQPTVSALSQDTHTTIHFSQSEDTRLVKDRRDTSTIDYSSLRDDLKAPKSDRDERKLRKGFEDRLSKLAAEIEGMTPNMKANEAYETVTEKLKSSGVDFDKSKIQVKKATAAFRKTKDERVRRFNDAFNHIDEALKTIYQDMTKSTKHPLGGNAYLSLDDTEEPYNGGMTFNAMPPMKRFRDMEQLSGGEKTVAALSLLFAIHSFRPAPFFVMDEVDAALDNVNLRKVCNYISQRSQTDFQCIVISLKDMFYERSQSLVGICRDVGTNSSRTLTLDLTRFADDLPAASGKKRSHSSVGSETSTSEKKRRSGDSGGM